MRRRRWRRSTSPQALECCRVPTCSRSRNRPSRLSGCQFRDFLYLNFPGYSTSAAGGVMDEYVKTVGKWEGVLFFYLGLIYFLKNLTPGTSFIRTE